VAFQEVRKEQAVRPCLEAWVASPGVLEEQAEGREVLEEHPNQAVRVEQVVHPYLVAAAAFPLALVVLGALVAVLVA